MVRCVRYRLTILTIEENRYPKQYYILLRRLDDLGRTAWATHIKRLLFQYGFGYVWFSEDVGDFNIFLSQFEQRLIDCSYQTLNGNIESSPKALSYKRYKSALNPEKYLYRYHINIRNYYQISDVQGILNDWKGSAFTNWQKPTAHSSRPACAGSPLLYNVVNRFLSCYYASLLCNICHVTT